MKLKKAMILLSAVCILSAMIAGCGSGSESAAKTEETQAKEVVSEELNNTSLKESDGNTEEPQENTAGKWQALEPDVASAVDTDILDSQVIYVVFEEDTHFLFERH